MMKKKWTVAVCAFLLVALLAAGYLAIAAEYGSKDDPLVTLSYITDVLSPETVKTLENTLNSKTDELMKELEAKISAYSDEIDKKMSGAGSTSGSAAVDDALVDRVADAVIAKMSGTDTQTAPAAASEWKVVKVDSGKTMMLDLGAQVVLRIGSGTCYSTGSTGLVDLTAGTTIGNGKNLSANHLYLVTIDSGRGVKATANMTVLVCGGYKIQ